MNYNFHFFNTIFHVTCIFLALYCVGCCFYNYYLDLDVSLVEHRKFDSGKDSIGPSVSLCLFDPFSENRFNENVLGFNKTSYTSFLAGEFWDERMLHTDFNKVTKNLDEYLFGYWVQWRNLTWKFYPPAAIAEGFRKPYLSYSGFLLEWLIKCYSVDIPSNAMLFGVFFNRSFFPNNIRPSFQGFGMTIHYPNQLLKSVSTMKVSWPNGEAKSNHSLSMQIKLNSFELTIRRNSRKNSCNPDLQNDDYVASELSLDKLFCHPPYYNWKSKYPICKTTDQLTKVKNLILKSRNELQEPCQSAEKIIYDHNDLSVPIKEFYENQAINTFLYKTGIPTEQIEEWLTTGFDITVLIPENKFKAIVHQQAYGFTNLIGNSGGYIGLFLGNFIQK